MRGDIDITLSVPIFYAAVLYSNQIARESLSTRCVMSHREILLIVIVEDSPPQGHLIFTL
jgi:hypothetical protein